MPEPINFATGSMVCAAAQAVNNNRETANKKRNLMLKIQLTYRKESGAKEGLVQQSGLVIPSPRRGIWGSRLFLT